MNKTKIQWTDLSVNPFRAWDKKTVEIGQTMGHHCVRISPGCQNCYASRMQPRFRMPPYEIGKRKDIELFLDEKVLQSVLRRRKPARIFWCDMTDMFLDAHPDEWIDKCFAVMALTPQHTHQVLTKRPKRMRDYLSNTGMPERVGHKAMHIYGEVGRGDCSLAAGLIHGPGRLLQHPSIPERPNAWPLPNVWLGVSVEDQRTADERIPILLDTPAAVRWVSAEPLLGPIDFNVLEPNGDGIWIDSMVWGRKTSTPWHLNWVVVGGESGPGARPCHVGWIRSIVEQCQAAGVACFVKQVGARPEMNGDDLPGEVYRELEANGYDMADIHKAAIEGRIRLRHPKGADPSEWPEDLRVREYPG